MPTLREQLKEHPIVSVLSIFASLATIFGFIIFQCLETCNKKKEPQAVVDKVDTAGAKKTIDSVSESGSNRKPITVNDRVDGGSNKNDRTDREAVKKTFDGIGVLATENGKFSNYLANKLLGWVSQGDLPKTILASSLISNGSFDRIVEHNASSINDIKPIINGYICLLRTNTAFEKSSIDESLKKAITKWELAVINSKTSEIIFSAADRATASDISEEAAALRNYEAIFNFLKPQIINFK